MDIEDLIARYDRRVPRYTSYPTAPHFSPAVDGGTYAEWLASLPGDTVLSLYVHVPFCASLCLFCGCHTTVVRRPEPLAAYARDLLDEVELVAAAIGRRLPVRHIHWGGGTPTALPADCMQAIDEHIRERFDVRPDAEIAVEIDPRTLEASSLAALQRIGVTRASLGVQDFHPAVQRAVGRIQSYEMTADCAARLRDIGVGSINLDLMYGLPHQTLASMCATIEQALDLSPDRAAVFGYAHVPWMKKHQTLLPEAALPDRMARHAQCRTAEQVLGAAGYCAIGLDHFAQPDDALSIAARAGRLRRNFQGYTTDDAPILLGLGASAIGSLPQGYVQNAAAVPAWREAIRGGRLPVARGLALAADDRLRRAVIERLMCELRVDLGVVAAQNGADVSSLMDADAVLGEMAADGLLVWEDGVVEMTEAGRPFVRCAAAAFDAYLASGAARHAVAV